MRLYGVSIEEIKKIPKEFGEKHFPNRMKRAERFVKNEDYLRCVGGGLLIKHFLNVDENDIINNEYGKPIIRNNPLFFNISHSGNLVVMAVDENQIGVDIELIGQNRDKIAKKMFLSDELEWLNDNPKNGFYRLWTLKESVMKQNGKGFSLSPKSFSVIPLINDLPITIDGNTVFAKSKVINDYMISVCSTHIIDGFELEMLNV